MKWKLTLTPLIIILFLFQSIAQQPVDCGIPSPPGADACGDACVYCDLTANGYNGSTIGYTADAPGNFCGTIENNQWFAFAAGTTTVEFTIIASNCDDGDGVQGAIYTSCPPGSGAPVSCDGGQNNGENTPIVVTANNLVIGNIYWFMVDGWDGDECDYNVTVTQGNTDPPPLDPPGPIDGPLIACQGDMATYSVPNLPGASYYEWTLPDGTVVSGNDPFVDYTFGDGGQVCVQANNVCNFSDEVCITVELFAPNAGELTITPASLCPNEIADITVTGYNMDPNFTQTIFISDEDGLIVSIENNTGMSSFTHDDCAEFQVCSYNYITNEGVVPFIGMSVNTIECESGCCDLRCQNISFEDTEAPLFPNAPPDETLTCFALLTPMEDLVWTDNCDGTGSVVGVEDGSPDLCAGGTVTRTWEYIDFCGNPVSHTQTITINPTPPAAFDNLPADMTISCDNVPPTPPDLTYSNAGTGACAISGSVPATTSGTSDICGGLISYTWEFTDLCNNIITHTQNITILPADPAVYINPPADMAVDCNNVPTTAPDLDYSNGSSGTCLIEGSVSPTQNGNVDVCGGVISYTWDYTDPCNNNIVHTQNINVAPADPPAFIDPPADMTLDCNNVPTSAPDLDYTNNGTGTCLFEGTVMATQSGNVDICGGVIAYTWEYTDPCNNNITHTQNITINPAPVPTFTNLPADETITCGDPIPPFGDLSYDNGATGVCSISGTTPGVEDNNYDACGGTITRTWTFTDPCSNTITHTQNITVNPGPPPVFSNLPADLSLTCGDAIPPLSDLAYDNGATGLCGINGSAVGVESGNYDACGGSLTRTWTYTDDCNNISHTQNITIAPAPAPVYNNPPADITVSCDQIPPIGPLSYDNGIAGNCNISGTVAGSENGGYNACGGSITRIWNATDDCGNPINHIQIITVDPAPPPAFINPPADVTVSCDALPQGDLSYDNGATGSCNISGDLTPTESGTYNSCGGSLIRTWTLTDICGNTITHTQNITVSPSPPPAFINPPADLTVSCSGIPSMQTLSYTNNVTGTCAVAGTVNGTQNGQPVSCGGAITREWSFTDPCGNVITHNQTITILPAPPPVFTNPPTNITITCGDPLPPMTDLLYTNNQPGVCAINGNAPGVESGTYDACGGILTRTWSATTTCGAVINHSQTININPASAPVFLNPPTAITVSCGDIPTIQPLFYTNGLSGLCEISGTAPGTESGTYDACGGMLTRNWDITDACGNTINASQTITVEPADPPQFVNLPPDITINCGETPPPMNDLFYDNGMIGLCASGGTVQGVESGNFDACGGALTRTWDFADACGNTITHTQTITALPSPLPIFELPPSGVVIECGEDYPMTALFYNNGATGICEISGSVLGVDDANGNPCNEDIIRTWTYTDLCGNTIEETELIISVDFTAPVLDPPPADQVLPCSGMVPPMTELGYTDNCIGSGTVIGFDVSDGGNPETITRTWEVLDDCGNSDIAIQIFVVNNFEILQALAGLCDNQGTLSDPSDDTYTVTVEASIGQPGPSNQYTVSDGTTTYGPFPYGSPATIPGLPADGSTITLTFSDVDDAACSETATVSQVACSTDCQLTIEPFTQSDCDDNGTPSDNTDDFFDLEVNASATNGGSNNQFTVTDGTTTWGPFDYGTGGMITNLPANGNILTLTFSDVDIPGCANQLQISSTSCSSLCLLTITDSQVGPCQNQGTQSDPADDTFDLTVNATAENPGSANQFTVTDGTITWGPFDYGAGGVITGLPANGNNITLTFNDSEDPTCMETVEVSQVSCSDLCVLTVDQITPAPCDNNGTEADPGDDFFEVTVNASALNPGASDQYTVTDGVTTWGPFDYGTDAIIGPLPANGNNLTLTFTDTDITTCAQQIQVSSNPCSSSCILAIDQLLSAPCSDNGTPSDPTDDVFEVTVNASATNPGATGQFTVTDGTTTWGPFDYGTGGLLTGLPADGSMINLTFTDVDDNSCNALASVSSASCSDLCIFAIDAATVGPCSDNGTNADPSDDTYEVTVNASATNGGISNQFTVTDGVSTWGPFDYGTGGTIPDLPANGNDITLIFSDLDNNTCTETIQVSSNPCSSSCILSVNQLLSSPCSDEGTPADPSDDVFEVTVNASATNPGASGQFTVTDGTTTWGPFDYGVGGILTDLPADGSIINLVFSDVDDISCNASETVSLESCSDLCVLSVESAVAGDCDDNGTGTDASDDIFEVTVNASALNPGVDNQYTVTDGTTTWGPFDYGTDNAIPNLPANGNNINLTFEDTNDANCSETVEVAQLPCSSSCVFSIDQLASGDCNDNGTPSDDTDDTFEVTVNASATNGGASNQYTVTDGATTWGPFDYGFFGQITDLPANGNIITLTFSDVDDISCNASETVSLESCSDLCILSIESAIAGDCDDNGTDTDASDDTFEVTVNATAINPGVDNQYTVTDGTTTWGPFDYGVDGVIPNLPANGINISLTFEDSNDANCSETVEVVQLPCSSSCVFSIDQLDSGPCDDNGTPSDDTDDTFEVTVNASATNGGASNQYTVTDGATTWGPFDYGFFGQITDLPANGNIITLTFSDVDDISCNASETVSLESCSDLCILSIESAIAGDCNDNGTDTDASDDTFEVTVNATAINPGADNQYTVTDGTTTWGPFDYGSDNAIPNLPANGNNISLTFEDTNDANCSETVEVAQLPCSSSCVFSIDQLTSGDCDDNGTPSDDTDDIFEVTINASATNGGASNQYIVSDGTTTWGPFDYGTNEVISGLPADGSIINLVFSDVDDISCNALGTVTSESCSDLCILSIEGAVAGPCDDNGTGTDPSDDTFEVTVNATAINPGVDNQYTVTDGTTTWGPFDYGTDNAIPNLPANGNNISLTFEDTNDANCSEIVEVAQLPCSSSCVFSIDQLTSGACDDNGTPSDDSDDIFEVTVNASATNGGTSNQYIVSDGTTTWGPFDYGTNEVISGLPADGSIINLVFSDVDDISCNALGTVSSESCSDLCILSIEGAIAGACDDNGTDTDASDDVFEVTVNATAINPGADNQYTVTDGTTTWGPFDYGVDNAIPNLPANGNNISLTFEDSNDANCSEIVEVAQLPCSSSCVFSIDQLTSGACDDNGTPSDDSDDIFEVTVNASATNGGASNQYIVSDGTTTWGPFDYGTNEVISGLPADGSIINLVFSDVDDISCNALGTVSSEPCSDLCVLSIEGAVAGACDDNGTDTDASDDTFEVTINATAINPGLDNQYTVTDGTTTWGPFDYGSDNVIPNLPANGNNISITFEDTNNANCSETVNLVQFPCSSSCIFAIDQVAPEPCDDNGTPSDDTDDTFDVTVNASATNGGANNQFTVTDGTTTWGPFDYGIGGVLTELPADGSDIVLTFADVDDISCNASEIVSSVSCSDLCVFTIEEALVLPCDDQGTLANPSDDLFNVTVNASAINAGISNQFTVTDGISTWGPFDYDVGGLVTGLSANGNNITLTFTDVDDLLCSSSVDVSQEHCSNCDLVIDAGPDQLMNCTNPVAQLFGVSSEPALFEWSGPGINASNVNEEQPIVDQPGTYTLTVSNPNTGCVEMDNVLVNFIDDQPIAMASGGEITCETTSVILSSSGSSAGSSIVYTWSGPDPDLDVNSANPETMIAGTYILVATDTTTNCVSPPDTVQVGSNTEPPTAIINLIGSLTCVSVGALIDGAGSSVGDSIQYQWSLGEDIIVGATDISYQATQEGIYTFVVLNILNGCDASDSLFVEDDMTYPLAVAAEPDLLTCYADSVQLDGSGSTNLVQITYEWTGPAGGVSSGGNTTMPWVVLPGEYVLSVLDTLNGCENLDTIFVNQDIVAPLADAGEDTSLDCISLEANLNGTNSSTGNNYGFEWIENNGNIVSGAGSLQPTVNASGDYGLLITNLENGCTATDNVLVTIPDSPSEVFYTAVDPVCFDDDNGFIVIDSVVGGQPPYVFSLDEQALSTNNVFSFLSSGTYLLNVEDNDGCSFQTSITLQNGNSLFIELGEDQTIDLGDSITLQTIAVSPTSVVDSLQWLPLSDPTFEMTLSCYNCYDPVAKPYRTTNYEATVWDSDGCIARDDITVNVLIDRNIYIPSAFSPNGDGINDKFLIYSGIDVLRINSFQIYDRWGEKVFEDFGFMPNLPAHGWDGTLRGEPMNPAVFVYWAEIEFVDGFKGFYKGDVTLVR